MTLQIHTFMYVIYILISFVQYTCACVCMYIMKPLMEKASHGFLSVVFSLEHRSLWLVSDLNKC